MKSFQISLDDDLFEVWNNENEQYHREDGPAFFNKSTGRGSYYLYDININKREFDRFLKTKELPLISKSGTEHFVNEEGKLSNLFGYALINHKKGVKKYFIDGRVYKTFELFDEMRRDLIKFVIEFCGRNLVIIKKLMEIPEMWEKVYYDRKDDFVTIKKKV